MPLVHGTVWTETLSAASAVDAVCDAVADAVGAAAEALFRQGEFTATRIRASVTRSPRSGGPGWPGKPTRAAW